MARARKGGLTQSKNMILIYGEQFTGKSTLLSQFAYMKTPEGRPFRVLYLDPESGSIDDYLSNMEMNGVKLDNMYIVYTQSLGEVREYINKVKNNEDFYELDEDGEETDTVVTDADGQPFRADAIVVDGTTILNLTTKQGLIEFSKKRNRVKAEKDNLIGDAKLVKVEGSGLELKDYQTVNYKGQDLVLDLMSSGVHCGISAREVNEKENVIINGKKESVDTGRKIPDGFKGMQYNCKTVLRTFYDKNTGMICAEVEKDRTGVHRQGEIIEDPTLLDWQAVIDKTAKNRSFVIQNNLSKAVETEEKIYTKELLGNEVVEPVEEKSNNPETQIKSLKTKIRSIQSSLSPEKKLIAKEKLKENGLPINIKDLNDIEKLNKYIATISEI